MPDFAQGCSQQGAEVSGVLAENPRRPRQRGRLAAATAHQAQRPTGYPATLPALTGLRFVAALHVVLFHYAGATLTSAHWALRAIVACGPSAVSLFYILSGAV